MSTRLNSRHGKAFAAFAALTTVGCLAAMAPAQASTPMSATSSAHASKGALTLTADTNANVGGCTVTAHAVWVRDAKPANNTLTVDGTVHDPWLFLACRDRWTVEFWSGATLVGTVSHDLPTACAQTDPTCPHDITDHFVRARVLNKFLARAVDRIDVYASAR